MQNKPDAKDDLAPDIPESAKSPIIIKKYANRRLYNTASSNYITMDHLACMIREGTDFIVYDAKTGDDITRSTLIHIIVEEEAKGSNMLPVSFLRHLISLYGDNLQELVPRYLETSMQAFAHNHEQLRSHMDDAMGGLNPFAKFEDMSKHNMALLESAMKIFSPFSAQDKAPDKTSGTAQNTNNKKTTKDNADGQTQDIMTKLEQMQKQLDKLSATKDSD